MVRMLEQKLEISRCTRVDSDVVDNLIVKEDKKGETLEANKQDAITTAFKSQLPKMDKVDVYKRQVIFTDSYGIYTILTRTRILF